MHEDVAAASGMTFITNVMMLHHLFQQLLDGKHHSYDGTTVMMVPQL
jgi:hypothetical protein